MLFDIILAKFLFDRKFSNNNIIWIIALIHLIMYFILYKYVFMTMGDSISVLILAFAVFMFFFSYRIYSIKKYLKSLIN
jgi:hypothetical protein